MPKVAISRLTLADAEEFLEAARRSVDLHTGWVEPPTTMPMFERYLNPEQQCCLRYVARNDAGSLVGAVNINAIIRGALQNGCLGFYTFLPHARQGYMRSALSQLIARAFGEHGLHRLEANVQPSNTRSCNLVESLGFRLEAVSPRYLRVAGDWRDHNRYVTTAEEWQPNGVT